MTRIGVYGTLKRGGANHAAFLADDRSRFVKSAALRAPYRLFGNHEYPMLVPSPEIHRLTVEIHEVDGRRLRALDRFEGRFGYRRVEVLPEGEREPLALYVHPGPPPPGFAPVPGGNWTGEPAAFVAALRRAGG